MSVFQNEMNWPDAIFSFFFAIGMSRCINQIAQHAISQRYEGRDSELLPF